MTAPTPAAPAAPTPAAPAAPTPAADPATPAEPQAPAAAAPAPTEPAKRTLEDSLANLDEDTRRFVLSEVQGARSEAKNLRERVKEAEPIVAQWRQLEEASKTELQKAQEALAAAEKRATDTVQQVAAAEVKAALTGVVPDPAAVIEDLNIGKFVTADGQVDAAAVAALRAKYATFAPTGPAPLPPNPALRVTGSRTPSDLDTRIAEAEKNRDFQTAIALKQQRAADARAKP